MKRVKNQDKQPKIKKCKIKLFHNMQKLLKQLQNKNLHQKFHKRNKIKAK